MLSTREISVLWDWREFSALLAVALLALALTRADPLALTGGRWLSSSVLFDRLWWHGEEREERLYLALWRLEVQRAVEGEMLGTRPWP